ncbi:MAG: thiolase family protein [Lacipirellulaceae bacterium]
MPRAVIIDAVRTPIGRAHAERGVYRDVRADDLAATVVRAVVERSGIDPATIDDVLLGCTQQQGEQGFNVARMVALLAGLPTSVPGVSVNRLCGSGLEALRMASHAIAVGDATCVVVGGVEHMHHLPMEGGADLNPRLLRRTSKGALVMGVTAEFLAQSHGVSRDAQDRFALDSHQKAAAAHESAAFVAEVVPVYGRNEAGERTLVRVDQCVRRDTSLEALAALAPAFMPGLGTVTAGNSSPLSDGAAALVVMAEDRALAEGFTPLARVRATAVVGVEPAAMGTGPIPATRKALERAGLTLSDIDLVELNEAFAAQALVCAGELGLDPERLNVRGGAIALGHPLGASGARIVATLVHAMRDRGAGLGLATMCIGAGQGIAVVLERV